MEFSAPQFWRPAVQSSAGSGDPRRAQTRAERVELTLGRRSGRAGCDGGASSAQPRGDACDNCCREVLGRRGFSRFERPPGGPVSEQVAVAVVPLEGETARMSVGSVLANKPPAPGTRIVAECTSLPVVADVPERRRAGGRQPPDIAGTQVRPGADASRLAKITFQGTIHVVDILVGIVANITVGCLP